MSDIMNNFNALKRKTPGMTDSNAMEKAMQLAAESRKRVRAADKKAMKKPSWIEKLKMAATGHIAEKYHSKAGREHLRKKRAGL